MLIFIVNTKSSYYVFAFVYVVLGYYCCFVYFLLFCAIGVAYFYLFMLLKLLLFILLGGLYAFLGYAFANSVTFYVF